MERKKELQELTWGEEKNGILVGGAVRERATEVKGGNLREEDAAEGVNTWERRALDTSGQRGWDQHEQELPCMMKNVIVGKGR